MRMLLLILPLLFLSCAQKRGALFLNTKADQNASIQHMAPKPITIKPHDRLSILFFEYPELSTRSKEASDKGIEVSDDGTVLLPIIGKIRVADLTTEELRNILYRRYSAYLENPALSVDILNQKIYVIGEVKQPGAFAYDKTRTFTPLKALSEAGGLTDSAARDEVYILRGTPEEYSLVRMNLQDLYSVAQTNITLMPDDIIYVAPNGMKRTTLPLNGIDPALGLVNTIFNAITIYKVWN
ncbi:MAG: hypothetical protein B6D59_02510 [Campylobacteraceae bacterium 4484_4]|nr:MAG: hypothetical protein B6D59_02510 [Campylobacteraceae bacterium 4484_4]